MKEEKKQEDLSPLYARVVLALKQVYDPEIPVNIYDLGLIYVLKISEEGKVYILMTFTAPNCPMADEVLAEVRHSVELTPGMYSDPDFTAKLWLCGVRYMKGLSASRVYHFESKSTGKVKKNLGHVQFLMKWGITSSTFRCLYTYRGRDFNASLIDNPTTGGTLRKHIVRGKIKALWYILCGMFRPIV